MCPSVTREPKSFRGRIKEKNTKHKSQISNCKTRNKTHSSIFDLVTFESWKNRRSRRETGFFALGDMGKSEWVQKIILEIETDYWFLARNCFWDTQPGKHDRLSITWSHATKTNPCHCICSVMRTLRIYSFYIRQDHWFSILLFIRINNRIVAIETHNSVSISLFPGASMQGWLCVQRTCALRARNYYGMKGLIEVRLIEPLIV